MIDKNKIHAIGCDLENADIQNSLNALVRLTSLAKPPVCFPDLHIKKSLEAPSSLTVATRGTIVPNLTTSSLGCGMGVIKTDLELSDLPEDFSDRFYREILAGQNRRPESLWKTFLVWLGILKLPTDQYGLTEKELVGVIRDGARAVLEKYGFSDTVLDQLEYRGNVLDPAALEKIGLSEIIPRSGWQFSRQNMGFGFTGNHFLEIQYVDQILNDTVAQQWGLKKNQIVIMYHGGDGPLAFFIGRYFSSRKKHSAKEKLLRFPAKLWFHFRSPKRWLNCWKIWRYYFYSQPFQEIPLATYEGQRLALACQASLNYGYAFRLAMSKRIFDALAAVLPKINSRPELLWDSVHTSIYGEKINGEELMVHRNATTRVFPGKPVIISGHHTTNSYLGIGLADAESRLFSADHGVNETIKRLAKKEAPQLHPEKYQTAVYDIRLQKTFANHTTNRGLDYVINHLEQEKIVTPVALFRALAVFRG